MSRAAGSLGPVTQTLHARSDGEFEPDAYTARHLLVLEGLEAVRKRPGMYIGSTDTRGLMHCLWEIIDNARRRGAGRVTAPASRSTLHADGSVEVATTAAASRSTSSRKTGLTGVEVVMTKLHAGGKFGGGSYAATGGLHGVGASVVNALSARLDVEVDRDGKTHAMSLPPRRARASSTATGPTRRSPRQSGLRVVGKVAKKSAPAPASASGRTGRSSPRTRRSRSTSCTPAPGRPRSSCPASSSSSATSAAGEAVEETFRHDGGISEFCEFLAPDEPVTDVAAAAGRRPLHRDRAGPRRRRAT